MDIQKLEKLNELKEKGILTPEEFEKQKKELLSDNKEAKTETPKKGINWKNVGISFLIALLWLVLYFFISGVLSGIAEYAFDVTDFPVWWIVIVLTALCLAIIASKLETKKYKNCSSPVIIFICTIFIAWAVVWIASYQFLQIKQGHAVLKDKK